MKKSLLIILLLQIALSACTKKPDVVVEAPQVTEHNTVVVDKYGTVVRNVQMDSRTTCFVVIAPGNHASAISCVQK